MQSVTFLETGTNQNLGMSWSNQVLPNVPSIGHTLLLDSGVRFRVVDVVWQYPQPSGINVTVYCTRI